MIALLLMGCETTVQFPPALDVIVETGFDTGPPTPGVPTVLWGLVEEASINVQCSGTDPLAIAFRTIGWADGATALIGNSATGVVEVHPMTRTSVQPGGDSESYQLGPLPWGTFDAGTATTFPCDTSAASLSVALLTTGRLTPYADCVVFGRDLADVADELRAIDSSLFDECRILSLPF